MVKVALAGASSGLGLSILQAIRATNKHTLMLLSRHAQPSLSTLGIAVHPVTYTDHAHLVRLLRGVHTLISTIATFDSSLLTTQLALLAAAKEAGVKRFAPSEYAGASNEGVDGYAYKEAVWEAVRASGLEYTRFACGLFMNLFVTGTPRGEEAALAGLSRWDFVVNIRAGTADVPGDGEARVTFTESRDVAKFVAASLDLDEWEEVCGMEGETLTFNEVVILAEKVTKRKFLVKYNTVDQLKEMADADPSARFYNQVRVMIAEGRAEVKPVLNGLCPEVRPWRLEDWLEKWWGGVELGEPAWVEPNIIA